MRTIKPLRHQFFSSKERHKRFSKSSPEKQTTFPLYLWIFFLPNSVSNLCTFCFGIFSTNLSGLLLHSLMKLFFGIFPVTFTVSKNCSVSTDAAFPLAMLYDLVLSTWSNGFIIAHRSIILCNSVLSFTITPYWRYTVTHLRFSSCLEYLTMTI